MMEVKKSNFIVRAIHTFKTEEHGELPLAVGDIVQVIKKVDKYWYNGYSNGRIGNFPAAFTVEIELNESLKPNWKLFAAQAPFVEQESEDLGFEPGDVIIGLGEVDAQWWRGRKLGDPIMREGIFPLTHVWQMEVKYLPKPESDLPSPSSVQIAIVDYDLKPEIPEEIPLRKGDRVIILGSHDRMYYRGESEGVVGIFPKRFVTIVQEPRSSQESSSTSTVSSHQQPQSQPIYENDVPIFASQFAPSISISRSSTPLVHETNDLPPTYEESIRSDVSEARSVSFDGIQSYAKVIYPFTAQRDNELTLTPGEIVNLIQYVDVDEDWILGELDGRIGMFPKDFVKIIVDCLERKKASSLVVSDYPPDTYARVLYSFNAEFEGEISVKEGSIVTLSRGFNTDWVEVVDDSGTEGIIPFNHVEVIGVSSVLSNEQSNSNRLNSNLMEFSPDEPDASSSIITDIKSLSSSYSTATSLVTQSRQSPTLSTVREETLTTVNPILTPVRPSPPVPNHPSSSSINLAKISPSPTPSPRTSSLGLPPSPKPHVPVRTSSTFTPQSLGHTPPLPPPPPPSSAVTIQPTNSEPPGARASLPTGIRSESGGGDGDRTEARIKKIMEQRSCIVTEMLQSERDYCQDLRVCAKTFLLDERVKSSLTEKGVILESLFSNLEEIITVSEKLTRSLEESTLCRKPENQMIGKCFLSLEEEMKQAYNLYCRDHEDVPVTWKKYEENPEILEILRKGLDRIKSETNCFDVPSLLIKPVQRILKYPLLLNELLKCTDESHPDREDIIKAVNMITDMAQDINEFKRRKDLVFKYRKGNNSSFSSKISKFTLHTMMKKSSRFGARLTSTFGFSPVTKDEKFEEEANKYKVLEKTIKIFLKDLNCFIESMQEFVNICFQVAENVAAFYAEKCNAPDVEAFRTSQRLLKTDHWEEMKKSLDSRVISVLKQLLSRFHNPSKLIDKRYDKLLDYDAATKKVESNKDPSKQRSLKEEQIMAKNNYEALNSQLLDELPLFTARTIEIIQGCVHAQIKIKKLFLAKITEEMMKLLDLPAMLGSSPLNATSVLETFQIKYNLIVDQMIKDFELVPASLFPNASVSNFSGTLDRRSSRDLTKKLIKGPASTLLRKSSSNSCGQSEIDRNYIENTYEERVYRVTRDCEATELAGISVRKDDIVGVIKYKDPTGNCHVWFVDNGSAKGFVPENILTPCPGTVGPINSMETLPNTNGATDINLPFSSTNHHIQRSNSSCSSASSTNTVASVRGGGVHPGYRTVARTAPKPPNHPSRPSSSIHRAESFSTKTPAPPPPLPPRSTSIDAGVCYDPNSREALTSLYQNLSLINCDSTDQESVRYSNIDEFDPLVSSKPSTTPHKVNNNPQHPQHRYEDIDPESEMRYENLATGQSTIINSNDQRHPVDETWVAAYSFNPQGGPFQVPLKRGTRILVLQKSDLNGNSEWWYIRNHQGAEGYVPANYLTPS